jgi:hypothetical protein
MQVTMPPLLIVDLASTGLKLTTTSSKEGTDILGSKDDCQTLDRAKERFGFCVGFDPD